MYDSNPYTFWKQYLNNEQFSEVSKGIKLFSRTNRETNFNYRDYIDITMINNKSPGLSLEMINSRSPSEFVVNNINNEWDWLNVGFFTCFEFRNRYLAYKVAKLLKNEN